MTDKPEETVTITIKEFQSLLQAQEWLSCLEDAIKLEVGKKYELNNGEVHECTKMRGDDPLRINDSGFGPFIIDGMYYHQDGRFADCDSDYPLSVKRCVTDDTSNALDELAELDAPLIEDTAPATPMELLILSDGSWPLSAQHRRNKMTKRKFTPPTEFPAEYVGGDGLKVVIYGRGHGSNPLIGQDSGGGVYSYTDEGQFYGDDESECDLHDIPKRTTTWHNVYSDSITAHAYSRKKRLCVYRIERDEDGGNPEIFVEDV